MEAGPLLQPLADGGSLPDASRTPDLDAATKIADASTLSRSVLVRGIPEAENLFFTDAGRLFVSGGENVFEITRNQQGTLQATDLFDESCLVEGIVEAGGYLYGGCSRTGLGDLLEAYLFGGAIDAAPKLRILTRLEDGAIPNGITVDEQGQLYVSCSGSGQIVRVTLRSPLEVARVETWAKDLTFVNGLKTLAGSVYFTSLSDELGARFGRMPIGEDGGAGAPVYMLERPLTVLDDLLPYEAGFVLTDYLNGSLVFWRDGKVYDETPAATFYSPTAVARGRPPMFSPDDLLVTEKGIIFVEDAPEEGDLLSVWRRK